jgi:hypothetical protein
LRFVASCRTARGRRGTDRSATALHQQALTFKASEGQPWQGYGKKLPAQQSRARAVQ